RACGDEAGCVFRSALRHLLEERAQHVAPRLRPRDVAHGNGDPMTRTHELAERRAIEWSPHRAEQRRVRVCDSWSRDRLDDGDPFIRKIDIEAISSVIQLYSHHHQPLTTNH